LHKLLERLMDLTEARTLLRRVRILADLKEAELDALAAATTWRSALAGDEIISHLDGGNQVFLVIDGVLRARLETALGRQVAIRQIAAGGHFGEIAALTDAPRSLSITAETNALLGECRADAFLELMMRNGRFATAVATHLARTVISLTDRVFELSALEVRFRVYAELLRLASSGEATNEGILIRKAPTHEAIASSVGAQREAVTRELRALASEDILRQTKREMLIRDIEALRELVRRRAGYTTSETGGERI
jgi:CRP-like cAMP-binding protein